MASVVVTNLTAVAVPISELYATVAPTIGATLTFTTPDWRLLSLPTLMAAMSSGKVTVAVTRTSDEIASTFDALSGSLPGVIKPTATTASAKSIAQVLSQSYTIDFGAFAGGGASQASAQTMTGVAFGDTLSVGVDADVSAEFATVSAVVTSAGNIKVVLVPLTAAGTVNPASHVYTVTAIRAGA